jgi:hypothetical protein
MYSKPTTSVHPPSTTEHPLQASSRARGFVAAPPGDAPADTESPKWELVHYRREIGVSKRSKPGPATFRLPRWEVLGEGPIPDMLERPEIPITTAPERELPLANPMGKLDAGQCYRSTPERLEASHRGATAFDRPMILLKRLLRYWLHLTRTEIPSSDTAASMPRSSSCACAGTSPTGSAIETSWQ